ncbi:hypothetical protein H6P81_019669 [Aristolochia fimbriata]|uniref:Nucleolar complex protein 3 homolog n=1 Tax=Aristolochia fimbriata TaxID=158543 RepID=A0AAV7DSL2_ARIFI|nr:hypothetical protein H6P81_019669 [Aristolochia fimbriata]
MGKKRNKIILPPQLPPDVADDEVEISDEDVEFVKKNKAYAGFLKNLDTKTINRHVVRVANKKEDDLESLYEKRNKKTFLAAQAEENGLKVDPVDVLPVKTLDGQLYYRTDSKSKESEKKEETAVDSNDHEKDKDIVKLTKAEKRAKLKKIRKEAKKQAKEQVSTDPVEEAVEEAVHSEVLAEVKEELSAEEAFERKKHKLAEVGIALLADPETNIKSLKELLKMCDDKDVNIVKLGLLSLLAIFKDIIPGYRIRLPTEKELGMTVSKAVRKMRFYESTLLSSYKAYQQKLINLQRLPSMKYVTVRCMCNLLDAVPHFNFHENLLAFVVKNLSSPDDVVRKQCCSSLKSLFANEGKHGGQATVEAVQLIANLVKMRNCQLYPDCLEVFLSLSFDEDLSKPKSAKEDKKVMHKKKRRRENDEVPNKVPISEKKKSKQELKAKIQEEVMADFKSTSFVPDQEEKIRMQSETLAAVFQTYFRVLKSCMESTTAPRSKSNDDLLPSGLSGHPLLAPCLKGLGKFSHLIDLDFMGDLMKTLKLLADGSGIPNDVSSENRLSVSERIQCCIVAFKVMRNNLDALNVDLHDFFVQLYNLLIEYNPERENQGEVLAEALKVMLCQGRQHDMQRTAAFVKRLATFCLSFGSAEAMAALVTLRHLLQMNVKCRNLLENDAGGGSLSGSIAKYQPDSTDPNLSGALASVLWELSLLSKHYHPAISSMASNISSMSTDHCQVFHSITSPEQAFSDLSIERESFHPNSSIASSDRKRKRGTGNSSFPSKRLKDLNTSVDENEVRAKLSDHFTVLKDISENERLRRELNQTLMCLSLYEEYKKQKKKKVSGLNKSSKKKGSRTEGP